MNPDPLTDFLTLLLIVLAGFLCGVLAVARAAVAWAEERARELADERYFWHLLDGRDELARDLRCTCCGRATDDPG